MSVNNYSKLGSIFIDGGYLNKVIEKIGKSKIDYLKLSDNICNLLKKID